jgi:hypothetical protein
LCIYPILNVIQIEWEAYKNEWNFIYLHKKSTAFPAQIFMKLTVPEQYYVQISYTKVTKIVQ